MKKFFLTICFAVLGLIFSSTSIHAQNITFSGVVVYENPSPSGPQYLPFPGVNVIQMSSTNGVITNNEGKFSISVPPNSVVLFCFLGYQIQSHVVDKPTTGFQVLMVEETIPD